MLNRECPASHKGHPRLSRYQFTEHSGAYRDPERNRKSSTKAGPEWQPRERAFGNFTPPTFVTVTKAGGVDAPCFCITILPRCPGIPRTEIPTTVARRKRRSAALRRQDSRIGNESRRPQHNPRPLRPGKALQGTATSSHFNGQRLLPDHPRVWVLIFTAVGIKTHTKSLCTCWRASGRPPATCRALRASLCPGDPGSISRRPAHPTPTEPRQSG